MTRILDDAPLAAMDQIASKHLDEDWTGTIVTLVDNVRRLKQALAIARPWVWGIEGDPAWEDMAKIKELVGE